MNKFTLRISIILSFAIALVGVCKSEEHGPDKMFFFARTNDKKIFELVQKVNSAIVIPSNNSIMMALEPVAAGQHNIVKLVFDPLKKNSNSPIFLKGKITTGPIRHIRISHDGKYIALTGRTRELVLLKDELSYAKWSLNDEVTAMEFDKNNDILVVGDRSGKINIIDIENTSTLNTFQLLDDEITSLAFYRNSQILVTGKNSHIHQVDMRLGKVVRTIQTERFKEKVLRLSGFMHCARQRINKILYIESLDKIVTAHGWDYCKDNRVGIWDGTSGQSFKQIKKFKSPVYHFELVKKNNTLVIVDRNELMWRMNMNDYSLSEPISLPKSMAYFNVKDGKTEINKTLFGHVQSVFSVPGKSIVLYGIGSYFKGGSGILFSELNSNHHKNLMRVIMDSSGKKFIYLNKDLYKNFYNLPIPRVH